MKSADHHLERLLKSAAAAHKPSPAPEFATEARVLGHWRGQARAEGNEFMVGWFRRAALCASLLALASIAWSYSTQTSKGAEQAIASSALEMGVEP